MKIAILYICTGKYSIFWNDFYKSSEKYFLPNQQKKYFVFTDTLLLDKPNENIELISQDKLGWPHDTLMRFHLFSTIANRLKEFDYLFFLNANTSFVKTVDDSIFLNDGELADLIVTKHPFFHWVTNPNDFPYERNSGSTANISKNMGNNYVLGGFNGGKSVSYLELIETLKNNIDKDIKKMLLHYGMMNLT